MGMIKYANVFPSIAALMAAAAILSVTPRSGSAQMSFTRTRLPSDSAAKRVTRDTVRDTTRKNKPTFSAQQQANDRVLAARLEKRFELKKLFRERGLTYPAAETFLRIFKRERVLEVWVRSAYIGQFKLLKAYPICAMAGALGPKRTEGDGQTPEGFYYIDGFNP